MMLSGLAIKEAIHNEENWNNILRDSPVDVERLKKHWKHVFDRPRLVIRPFVEAQLNPNSYNCTLHPELKVYNEMVKWSREDRPPQEPMGPLHGSGILDPRQDNPTTTITIPEEGLPLEPGVLYLARTNEYTESWNCVPQINGRSSIGRLGISVHATAGFGDVGFCGTWTLEIAVVQPVMVYPNMQICQLSYMTVSPEHENYKGRYVGQVEATSCRLFTDNQVKT